MKDTSPRTLLVVMVVAVPVIVAVAALAAFLMLRAGYGLMVSGLLPLLGMTVVVVVLGVFLGRASGRNRGSRSDRDRGHDGV